MSSPPCSRAAPPEDQAASRGSATAAILRLDLHFTATDRAALAAWTDDARHGYDRLQLERAVLDEGWANYALVYAPGQAWSSWGLTRCNRHVEVWRCATGQTLGRHERMADALASLPPAPGGQSSLKP